jgi:hypothetical protein
MGEGQRAERAEPLADVDWVDVFARAGALAQSCVPEQDIDDVVTEGITRLREESATYDREIHGDLALRVVEVGRDALRGERQKVQRWASAPIASGVGLALHGEAPSGPEEVLSDAQLRAQKTDVLEPSVMLIEAERVAALDDAGLDRELAASGRTLEGERAKGRALIERLRNPEPEAVAVAARGENHTRTTSGFRPRSRSRWSASAHGGRRPTLLWMLAAAVAMAGAVVYVERRELLARFRSEAPPSLSPYGPQ